MTDTRRSTQERIINAAALGAQIQMHKESMAGTKAAEQRMAASTQALRDMNAKRNGGKG